MIMICLLHEPSIIVQSFGVFQSRLDAGAVVNLMIIFFTAPLFIFQWQFDSFQLYADNVANPASSEQWDYIHTMGSNLRSTFENLNGLSAVFSPSCIAHEVITKMEWTEVTVEGVSLPDALACWSQSLPDAIEPPPAQIRAGHPASHSRAGGESSDNEVLYDTDNRGQLQ